MQPGILHSGGEIPPKICYSCYYEVMKLRVPPIDSMDPNTKTEKIFLGISSCLLGNKVRYDGGHKKDHYINDVLSRFFAFQPICPEIEIGLGLPRKPIRLIENEGNIRAVGVDDPSNDVTSRLQRYAESVLPQLSTIRGYIFKNKSPSCGMSRVKVYSDHRMPHNRGTGIYAGALMHHLPLLPVEDEGRLHDFGLRENFIVRIYAYDRWKTLHESQVTAAKLIEFHARHKLLLMSHSQAAYRNLGRLVAGAGTGDLSGLTEHYGKVFMATLKRRATRKNHTNVLQHLLGYLKRQLDSRDKQEMLDLIDRYRTGNLPLIVPITLLKHHFHRYPNSYVKDQIYLDPSPAELALRNHI